MSDLYNTGIRPAFDNHIAKRAAEKRDYGKYWSASSAGYCMRLNILRRLGVEKVPEIAQDERRTQRVFECGHVFHEYMQRITKEAGLSVAQELELQDEDLLVRGHIDDLILMNEQLILYDYKTANSMAFNYKKPEMGHYHGMQLATYMYMLRKLEGRFDDNPDFDFELLHGLAEARILTISKDDLRQMETQLIWSEAWEKKVVEYWKTLQGYWEKKTLPRCTCLDFDGGFLGRRSKKGKIYNDFFYNDVPCSEAWIRDKMPEGWSV